MSEWIKCSDRMPELDLTAPSYKIPVHVLVSTRGNVREMVYSANPAARTAKSKLPRWEETRGCLAWSEPTHWMPLPSPPEDSQ